MKRNILFSFSFILFTIPISAQLPFFRVFLDQYNPPYNIDYLRTEVRFVQYVSDADLCDVQVQSTPEFIGNNSSRQVYYFYGHNQFAGINDTVVWHIDPGENEGSIREKSLRAFRKGLLPYLLRTEAANSIDYDLNGPPDYVPTEDPWNEWTLSPSLSGVLSNTTLRSHNAIFVGDSTIRQYNYRVEPGFSAWKVGEKWKAGLSTRFSHNERNESFSILATPTKSTTQSFHIDGYVARMLTQHWGVGISALANYLWFNKGLLSSGESVHLGVEYNFFPYRAYFRRRIVAAYYLGFSPRESFNAILPDEEGHFRHILSLSAAKIEHWGYINGNIEGSAIPNSFWLLYGISAEVETGLNLGHNVFLTLSGNAQYGNQNYSLVNLLTDNPVVASKQARAFNIDASFGLRYYFGSGFRSIVNPRLLQIQNPVF